MNAEVVSRREGQGRGPLGPSRALQGARTRGSAPRRLSRACLLGIFSIIACGHASAPTDDHAWPDPPKDAIVKPTESGPVKATVSVWPPKPTLGDPIYVRLTVEAQAHVTVDVPFERDVLGGFKVAAFDAQHDHGKDGGPIEIRTYELEAPSSGRHRIPPLRFEFLDGRPGQKATEKLELLTDEVPLEVGAVSTDRTNADLKPPKGAIDPIMGRRATWPWIAGAVALGLIAAIGYWVFVESRRRYTIKLQVSAYETALGALAALEARGAPAPDDADAWFVELSAIVRRYLEGRFGVRAPELTTEEFLQEARRSNALDDEHRDRLGDFLERCDRVKFAGWRPQADESLATLGAARAFVQETKAVEVAA